MSLSLQIDSNAPEVRARLDALLDRIRPNRDLHLALAEGGKQTVREHFRRLALRRNSSGGAGGRKAFYAIARDSTHAQATGIEATIAITGPRGIRLRRLGGTLRAKPPRKYLAVPLVDRLRGVRAAEVYDELDLRPIINRRTGKGILYSGHDRPRNSRGNPTSPRPGEKVTALYALVRRIRQKADPTVLPPDRDILTAALEAARAYIAYTTRTT